MASATPYEWTREDKTVRKAYRARWQGADGKPQSKRGFTRKGDALKFAGDQEAAARHGIALGEVKPTSSTTLKAWSQTWLEGLDVRDSTADAYGFALRRILPALGSRPLADLRPSELKSWRRGLVAAHGPRKGKALAPSTTDFTVAVLAMMLRAAVQDGLIERSPLPANRGGIGGRVVDPDELLTLAQVRAWGAAMPAVAREMPLVAAMTGLRQGELLGLQLANVDFLRRQVRVHPEVGQLVSPVGKGGPVYGPPKTAAGARTVPLPTLAAEALSRHLARQPAIEGEPIFRGSRGQRWRRTTFGDVARHGAAEAKLPAWAHWHGLRDVYASTLVRQGIDVRTLVAVMGHTSPEESLRTYSKLWADARDNARLAVDRAWGDGQGEATGSGAGH